MPAPITNGESGASVRSKINAAFSELNGQSTFPAAMTAGGTASANRAALQAAIDAAEAAGGGVVTLPPFEMSVEPGVELKGGVSILGQAPKLDFFQNCPDLLHTQTSGTRLVGAGSGSLFVARKTPNLTGPAGGPVPTWPDSTSDGIGMMTIGRFGVRGYDIGIDVGAKNTNGFAFAEIDAIHFEDMNDWCMRIINPQHLSIHRVFGYNVKRGVWMQGDNAYCAPGISHIDKSFFYLQYVGAGEDYSQRYGIYITCDSDLVAQPFQMDGIRIQNSQINMYSGVAVADSIHICVRGNADGARVVNTVQIKDTNLDGRSTHAVELTNAYNAILELSHHPATIDGGSSIRMRNAKRAKISSQNVNTIIDADAASFPYYADGEFSRYTTGSAVGLGVQRFIQSGGRFVIAGSQYEHKLLTFDASNNTLGPFTFNPANPATPNGTWLAVATMGTHSDQNGTPVNMSADRAGVWKATNSSNATWNLPTSNLCRGHEFAIVKKSGAGTVTIDAGAGRTIGYAGQTYALGSTVGASVHLLWDDRDNNWHILGKN